MICPFVCHELCACPRTRSAQSVASPGPGELSDPSHTLEMRARIKDLVRPHPQPESRPFASADLQIVQ